MRNIKLTDRLWTHLVLLPSPVIIMDSSKVHHSLWHSLRVRLLIRNDDQHWGTVIETRWFSALHHPQNGEKKKQLSLPRSVHRPAVAPLSCAAVKFSPSQAPSDPPLLTSSATRPKNTELGREAAILVNSAHKGKRSHWKQVS